MFYFRRCVFMQKTEDGRHLKQHANKNYAKKHLLVEIFLCLLVLPYLTVLFFVPLKTCRCWWWLKSDERERHHSKQRAKIRKRFSSEVIETHFFSSTLPMPSYTFNCPFVHDSTIHSPLRHIHSSFKRFVHHVSICSLEGSDSRACDGKMSNMKKINFII